MLTRNKRRNTRELKLAPVELRKPMAFQSKPNDVQMDTAVNAAPPAEDGAPLGQALQSLFALVGQLRTMTPEGAGASLNPKLILTGSGLELRLSGPESSAASESPDRLGEIERGMKLLSARIAKMEEQLGSQNVVVDSLRVAIEQNEEMMETLVDSMSLADDLARPGLGFERMPAAESMAS
jgi:hypothetical protein